VASLERQYNQAVMFAHLYGVACINGMVSQNIAVLTIEKQLKLELQTRITL